MPRSLPLAAVGALVGVALVKVAFDLSWFAALVAAAGLAGAGLVWATVERAFHDAFRGPHDRTALDGRALDRFARSERMAQDIPPSMHPPRQEPP